MRCGTRVNEKVVRGSRRTPTYVRPHASARAKAERTSRLVTVTRCIFELPAPRLCTAPARSARRQCVYKYIYCVYTYRQPLDGKTRPFECMRDNEIIEERRVLLPNLRRRRREPFVSAISSSCRRQMVREFSSRRQAQHVDHIHTRSYIIPHITSSIFQYIFLSAHLHTHAHTSLSNPPHSS